MQYLKSMEEKLEIIETVIDSVFEEHMFNAITLRELTTIKEEIRYKLSDCVEHVESSLDWNNKVIYVDCYEHMRKLEFKYTFESDGSINKFLKITKL